jgi:hypothetical protein
LTTAHGTPILRASTTPEGGTVRTILVVIAVLAAALTLASSALATYGYVWPSRSWSYGQDAGSTYSSSWKRNWFQKSAQGYDTSVTFIDNVGYGWHNTVRNRYQVTATDWYSTAVKKAYARSYASGFSGNCVVWDY